MKVAFYSAHWDTVPAVEDLDWSALVARLSNHRVSGCKDTPCVGKCAAKNGPAWAPHDTEKRDNRFVRAITVAVFDLDHQRPEELAVLETVEKSGHAFLLHSTHSHRPPDNYSFRVVFPLSRPVLPAEWLAVRTAAARKFGFRHDEAAKDPARIYYLPTTQPGVRPIIATGSGAVLDVDALLSTERAGAIVTPTAPSTGVDVPTNMDELARELLRHAKPENRAMIRAHLNGEPLPIGDQDNRVQKLMSTAAFVLPDSTPDEAVLELFRPCFAATDWREPGGTEHLIAEARKKLQKNRERRQARDAERAEKNAATWGQLGIALKPAREPAPLDEGAEDPDAWASKLLTYTKKDQTFLKNCEANLYSVLKHSAEWRTTLRFNDVTKEIECSGSPVIPSGKDSLDADIAVWFQQSDYGRLGLMAKPSMVREVMRQVAHSNSFDPLREYLDRLIWDGVSRVDTLLTRYFGATGNPDYLRVVGSKWLISAVARALRPGCKVDTMVVLEGPQGLKKSTALRTLAGEWFCDAPFDLANKDSMALTSQSWFIEFAELQTFKRATDVEALKACLSRNEDTFRPPYGRTNIKTPRRCIFVGTTNADDYLRRDASGYRRFWPVRCGVIDIEGLKRDAKQIWAEAAMLFHRGEQWWLTDDEARLAESLALMRVETTDDVRKETIFQWLLRSPPERRRREVTILEAASDIFGLTPIQMDKRVANEISSALLALGCTRHQPGTIGRTRVYRFPDALLIAPQLQAPAPTGVAAYAASMKTQPTA